MARFSTTTIFVHVVNKPTSGTPPGTPCKLTFTGGDGDEAKKAAWYSAMRTVYQKLIDMGIKRIQVAREVSEKLEEDFRKKAAEHDLGGARGNRPDIIQWDVHSGNIHGYTFSGPMSGRNLAWYISKETINRMSTTRFEMEITDQTNSRDRSRIGYSHLPRVLA